MQRVLVVGAGGAGKSTVAVRLGQLTGLPVVHLDREYWRSGWVEPERAQWEATVDRLITADRWILDGNFGGTMERRIAACDTVVFLDLPRHLCLWRVLKRRLQHRAKSRVDMAPGCDERLSLHFLWWIWSYPWRRRPALLRRLQQLRAGQRAVILRSDAEIERFLAAFTP
ncbi:isopentenyl transferase family protein [Lysobacter terrae]